MAKIHIEYAKDLLVRGKSRADVRKILENKFPDLNYNQRAIALHFAAKEMEEEQHGAKDKARKKGQTNN